MTRWTIDTNVPVVANGRDGGDRPASVECRQAAVQFLLQVVEARERIVLDQGREIENEYRGYLHPSGQPGVGDRFYQMVLTDWDRCERILLPRRPDGQFADLPQAVIDSNFDQNDRKFAALSAKEEIPVVNAVDSDWVDSYELLTDNGICVKHLCGCDETSWFAT